MLEVNDKSPELNLKNQQGQSITLKDLKGGWTVVYFYPKDDTPGCTQEAKEFTEKIKEFENMGVEIIGISPDNVESHCKFADKHKLEITLLSDPDHLVTTSFDCWALKKFMGREYMGVVRSTFILGPDNRIAYFWRNIKVKNHVEDVLNKLKELTQYSKNKK